MEEKNTTNPNEKNDGKEKPAKAKENHKETLSDKWQDHKAEFHKIIWPKKEELGKKTITVIFTSLLVGALIFCMDTVYTVGYNVLLNLLG